MSVASIRKDLHQIPELGRQEYKTKEYILNFVKDFKCEIFTPTKTSVVLYFDCQKEHTICFRADMDALPICEKTNLEFQSKHNGLMHACAHDGHMAMLLQFAIFANENLDKLQNNIVCLFQPSEEDNCGANDIIESKILTKLNVERIFGFHIWPNLNLGKIYTMPKGMLASSCEVNIDIVGKSVHAANKKDGIDALYIATRLINEYYDQMKDLDQPHLIHFGKMVSGTARNIVASQAKIEGTLRAFSDETFDLIRIKLQQLASNLAKMYNTEINVSYNGIYPAVINDSKLVFEYKDVLNLEILTKPFLQAEDFGCYTRHIKSMFMLIGCGSEHLLHTDTFDFDMNILNVGVEAYVTLATFKFSD